MATFEDLMKQQQWRAIENCPGRFVLASGPSSVTPEALCADDALTCSQHRSAQARDEIFVLGFEDGGLISYRKPDGAFVHTLCNASGFARKLQQLDIKL